MIDLNKVLLAGRLTKDPELRYIPSGTAVCDMRIAADHGWGDRKETLFINVTAWGKTAEFCNEYMRKGKAIFIEGRLKLDTWQDKEGNNRERIHIVADRAQFAESKSAESARPGDSGQSMDRDPGPPQPAASRSEGPSGQTSGQTSGRLSAVRR